MNAPGRCCHIFSTVDSRPRVKLSKLVQFARVFTEKRAWENLLLHQFAKQQQPQFPKTARAKEKLFAIVVPLHNHFLGHFRCFGEFGAAKQSASK